MIEPVTTATELSIEAGQVIFAVIVVICIILGVAILALLLKMVDHEN